MTPPTAAGAADPSPPPAPPTLDAYRRMMTAAAPPARIEGGARLRGDGPADAPAVSLITVVRNGADGLERTIRSVLGQRGCGGTGVEYIVVDGGSTDGTLDILRRHGARLAYWLSEPDRGISDAFNKGIALARGAFIGLLNADDWLEPDQIARGVAALRGAGDDAAYVFGDVLVHGPDGGATYRLRGDPGYARVIASRMPALPHPTVLARRAAYERFGLFDLRYRYAMDYEWLLRLHAGGAHGLYAPGLLGHMSQGGASDANFRVALREMREISVRYGYPRARAWPLYVGFCAKSWLRRRIERSLPPSLRALPRRLVNRHCDAAAASP